MISRLTATDENGVTRFRALGMYFVTMGLVHEITAVITRRNGNETHILHTFRAHLGKPIFIRGNSGDFLEVIAVRIAHGQREVVSSVSLPWDQVRFGKVIQLHPYP